MSVKPEVDTLTSWLVQLAYPCWYARGVDHVRGGFHESLRLDGEPSGETRRARLYPRQIYAFSVAGRLGWPGPVSDVVRQGLGSLLADYRRPDGLYRTLVAPNGAPLVERAVLYDQAFVLLGFARAHRVLGEPSARDDARDLLARIEQTLRNSHGGFEESAPRSLPLLSNSHMHLLEACLEWTDQDDRRWSAIAAEIVELALQRFQDPASGFIREYFDGDWSLAHGPDADVVEPGHQYEWAWLLLRWSQRIHHPRAAQLAIDLIDRAKPVGSIPGAALRSTRYSATAGCATHEHGSGPKPSASRRRASPQRSRVESATRTSPPQRLARC